MLRRHVCLKESVNFTRETKKKIIVNTDNLCNLFVLLLFKPAIL